MEGLVRAAADFLAALLGVIGVVGRPRRRAGIREDLDLLLQLGQQGDHFGAGSVAHSVLIKHIELEVAKLAGADVNTRRDIHWGSIVTYIVLGLPLGYLTFVLDRHGFHWYSVPSGLVVSLLLLATFGSFVPDQSAPKKSADDQTSS